MDVEKIYCSLDIETSGFDPLANEILEVGFVMFKVQNGKIKVTEEWTQVFNPSQPVSPQILALTGISQKELDEAPKFSEHQEFLQGKLGEAVIVGHNIIFDVKFLQAFGIKFSGPLIDTLDLVQFLLPTHHSYNLENLMHTFGISHKEAHRALADSKATLKLLEKLLGLFAGLSEKLRTQIVVLAKQGRWPWEDLFSVTAEPIKHASINEGQGELETAEKTYLKFKKQTVFSLPYTQDFTISLAQAVSNNKSGLLVVPKAQQVLDIFRRGLIKDAVFLPEWQFDKKKFAALLKKTALSDEEIKFALKILVWQETNWQTETILDLNLSFFGGQFRSLITGGKIKSKSAAGLIACDHETFLQLSSSKLYSDRQVIICGLSEFENAITKGLGTKISWGYISYTLKSFYNFELDLGQPKFKKPVEEALAATDLFFGLVNALLQTDPPSFQYYKITPPVEYQENYQKIKTAAENYTSKLSVANEILEAPQVADFVKDLQAFFESEPNRVKWIELAENRCSFLSMPIEISSIVQDILQPFKEVCFTDSLGDGSLFEFFMSRLGIKNFQLEASSGQAGQKSTREEVKQGDLFSGIKKAFSLKKKGISYHCLPQIATQEQILSIIQDNSAFPAAILFASQSGVKEFYEQHYLELKSRASVLSQFGSGGSNKIFRNFSISPQSLLLATDKLVLRHLSSTSAVEQVLSLPVKTLIICRLPFEQFTHPYQEAVSQSLTNAFMDYSLPKALFNFHSVIKFFQTPLLEDIYVIDGKLSKEYAKVFKDYYKFLPNCQPKA